MTSSLSNHEIADVFHAIANSLEIKGEDRFRVQAYRRVGDAILELPEPLTAYRERNELETIPGVGKTIADKIRELLDTGQLKFYERLKEQVPTGLLELLRMPNVGPRTVGRLYRELGIDSLESLKIAAEKGRLGELKGFGSKSVE